MGSSNDGGEDELQKMAKLSKTLKQGERILPPTRRPDGTLRKPIKIRAGYNPQDEVAVYKSKGTLWKEEMAASSEPPGPVPETKPKTKSEKRNERKKEKRQQAALEKGKNSEATVDGDMNEEEVQTAEDSVHASNSVATLTSQLNQLAISTDSTVVIPPTENTESTESGATFQNIDKKLRSLKKKIRLAEAKMQKTPSQETMAKIEGWLEELKLLEGEKAEEAESS